MSDEVDDLLRRAMATLDRKVPSGYFDTLADRVAARLDAPEGAAPAADAPLDDELARERARRAASLPPPAASLPAASLPAASLPAAPAEPARKPTWGRHLVIAAGFGLSVAAAVGVLIFITYEERDRQADALVALETAAPAAVPDDAPARPSNAAPSAAGAGSAAPAPAPAAAIAAKGDPAGKAAPVPIQGKPRGKLSKSGREPPELPQGNAKGALYSLSKDDFQRGMEAVAARARSCFAGTRGTAALQVTVAPTGKVTRTVVSGVFAGTPAAACLQRAVAAATFPSWIGKPQRYAHSYLLSE